MTLLKMNHMRMKEHTISAPETVTVLWEEYDGHWIEGVISAAVVVW
jgi:hypothetical protein